MRTRVSACSSAAHEITVTDPAIGVDKRAIAIFKPSGGYKKKLQQDIQYICKSQYTQFNKELAMIVAHMVLGPSNTRVLPHNELGPVKLKRLVWNSTADADSVGFIGNVT